MTALSIRNRIEYGALGIATTFSFGWLAYQMVQNEGDTAGFAALIVGLFGLAIGRQMIFFPPSVSLRDWCLPSVSPGYYGIPWTGGGVRIIRPNGPNVNILFNLDGDCIGDEDYTLGKWRFHPVDSDCRHTMPVIAYWRTKRQKPIGMR